MAVILATSRLIFCTSSSLSCCSSAALGPSPRTTSSIAAFRRLGRPSDSVLVTFMIIARSPDRPSCFFLADPTPQNLHGNVGLLGDFVSEVLGKDLGLFGNDGGEPKRSQGLIVHFLL